MCLHVCTSEACVFVFKENHFGCLLPPSGIGLIPIPALDFWFCLCECVLWVRKCVCVCARAELHLSSHSFPFLGSISRLKLKRRDFFFSFSPLRSPPRTKFGEQLGRPWRWFVSLCPSAWQVENMHTHTHTHTHTHIQTLTRGDADTY